MAAVHRGSGDGEIVGIGGSEIVGSGGMIEVGVGDGATVGVGIGVGVRVGTGVRVGVGNGDGEGACVGATVGTEVGLGKGAGVGGSGGGVGGSVAGAARGGVATGSGADSLPVGFVWLPSTTPGDGAGDEVTFGDAFVLGVAVLDAGEVLGAVIGPRAGGAIAAGRTTISPPNSRPIAAPARPSRN